MSVRIVINPTTMKNEKDAACVAWNEAFRLAMEANGFDPVSQPSDEQRRFFADTPYRNDENMLRRTILARICTFDTSVPNPTDEQLEEAVEFLESVLECGFSKTTDEQAKVKRILEAVRAVRGIPAPKKTAGKPEGVLESKGTSGVVGGGENGKIGIGNRIKDPKTGKEVSALSSRAAEIRKEQAAQEAKDKQAQGQQPQQGQPQQGQPQQGQPQQGQPQQGQPQQGQERPQAAVQQQTSQQPKSASERAQAGQDGHIGIGQRIVDPKTGKEVSALSARAAEIRAEQAKAEQEKKAAEDKKDPAVAANPEPKKDDALPPKKDEEENPPLV